MDGFSFPPPPPPPPKAASSPQENAPAQLNNRGGRGGRGGRGSFRGRGGARGGRQQQPSYQYNNTGGYGSNTANLQQSNNNNSVSFQQQYQAPPGSYVNPAFGGLPAHSQSYAPVPQYGQSHAHHHGQYNQSLPQNTGTPDYPPGQKRTREQAFGQTHKHPMKKPSGVPKAQVAPAVPSFGAPLPLPQKPASLPSPSSVPGKKQSKPSVGLGLVPQNYGSGESSSEEEEEVDEEAAFTALQSGPLNFEFNGEISTLKSPADIADWIQERKKLWPSKRRIEERQHEVQSRMNERKRIEEETRAAIAVASGGQYQPIVKKDFRQKQKQQSKPVLSEQQDPKSSATLEETQRELALQMQKVQELQKLLAEKEHSQKSKAAGQNIPLSATQGDQEAEPAATKASGPDETAADAENREKEVAPEGFSENFLRGQGEPELQSVSSGGSTSDSSESDDDSAPEETSSKLERPLRVPPPQQSHPVPKSSDPRQCISFASQGRCKFGDKCRFKHDTSSQPRGKRKTLYQRLVEQERDEENKLAVQAIKYLGSVGFFSRPEPLV